ncbi:hypothetical protein GX48_01536 [Paracoccidioides brasiliensis]|nr:hypothetical protein GX48_01536 [Paracoccidioides brasiliensis]
MSDEDVACDSRTASVGLRARNKDTSSGSQGTFPIRSADKRRSRKNHTLDSRETQDFVPKGTLFTSTSLAVYSASSSSPDTNTENSCDTASADRVSSPISRPLSRGGAPSMNWNKLSKGTVRTALRGRRQTEASSTAATSSFETSFETVNGKYWRNRSTSASSRGSGGDQSHLMRNQDQNDLENSASWNKLQAETSRGQTTYSAEFSDMESGEDTHEDNDIVLNLSGPVKEEAAQETRGWTSDVQGNDLPREDSSVLGAQYPSGEGFGETIGSEINVKVGDRILVTPLHAEAREEKLPSEAPKAEAIRLFRARYHSDPITLADLTRNDLEIQARYIFFDMPPEDLDLRLPVRCTECMKEGHLADICPSKECEHCGAWSVHESRFCPSWRRCQRCRERGHDAVYCHSPLKGSATEQPCDFCSSKEHTEDDCDLLWKLPKRTPTSGRIFISISCGYCTSNRHLIGDCPMRDYPMDSSSFSLKHYDPSMFSNLNSFHDVIYGKGNKNQGSSGHKVRGRADGRLPSPESDGAFGRPDNWKPLTRSPPRSRIRFSNGIGRGRNLDDDTRCPQVSENGSYNTNDYRRGYRDRDQYHDSSTRQRSLSPNRSLPRQMCRSSNWHSRDRSHSLSPPRSPPRPRRPPPQQTDGRGKGRGGGGPRSRGRGVKGGSNRETYRHVPSAAKKAWEQHRF